MVGEVVVPPSKKLEDLIRLAELCVDLLRQNEEFYAEVRSNVIYPYKYHSAFVTSQRKKDMFKCSPFDKTGDVQCYLCFSMLGYTLFT